MKQAWEVMKNEVVLLNGEYKLAKEFLYTTSINNICTIPMCSLIANKRGMCDAHYQDMYRKNRLPHKARTTIRETTAILFHDGSIHRWNSNDLVEVTSLI